MRCYVIGIVALASACGSSTSSIQGADAPATSVDAPSGSQVDAHPGANIDGAPGSGSVDARPGTGADAPTNGGGADAPTNAGGADAPTNAGGVDAPAAGTPDAPVSEAPDAPPVSENPDAPIVTASAFHYVMSDLKVGATAAEARTFAFDLDDDGAVDDALGLAVISIEPLVGLDIDGTIHDALVNGTIVILDAVHADALDDDATADWQVLIGDPQPNPDLTSGNGMFTVSASSPTNAVVAGGISAGTFAGGPSEIALDLALLPGSAPVHLRLVGAHIASDVTEAGCTNGRLGGGIPQDDVNNEVLPAVATFLNDYVHANPGTPATALILLFFDTVAPTGTITVDDLLNSNFVKNLLKPDVDLLDAEGHPGHDGVKESVSLALGFTCTKAVFK